MSLSKNDRDCRSAPQRKHLAFLLLVFAGISIYGSWVPFHFVNKSLPQALTDFSQIKFISQGSRSDWAANFLLFLPVGFLGTGLLQVDRSAQGRYSILSVLLMMALSFSASFLLEFSQEWFPNRVPSVNDICAQSLGAFWGGIGWMFAGQSVVDWARRWSATIDTRQRLNKVLSLAVAAHVLSLVLPLDLTIRPSDLWHKYKAGSIRLVPLQDPVPKDAEAWFELAFLIGGSAVAGWLMTRLQGFRECAWRRVLRLLLGGLIFCSFLEFIQLLVYSRSSKVDDVILGSLSFAMGGLLLPSAADDPFSQRYRLKTLMATLYLVWLFLFYWWPLDLNLNPEILAERGKHFFKVPFVVLHAGSYVNALAEILRKVCLFALLAMLFAAVVDEHKLFSLSRRSFLLVSWGGCLLVGVLIEVGQVALPSRSADLTDVIVYGTGGAFGMLLASYLKGPNTAERGIQFTKCNHQDGRVD